MPARPNKPTPPPLRPGRTARAADRTLDSSTIGILPILDRFFDRLCLRSILRDHLPREDRRCRIATATGLLLLLKNLLVSREPLYGIGEWAARHVPELLGLCPAQLSSLNDDRVGRCLDRLFDADIPTLALAVIVHAVRDLVDVMTAGFTRPDRGLDVAGAAHVRDGVAVGPADAVDGRHGRSSGEAQSVASRISWSSSTVNLSP
jgi:hypothetical protein